MPKKPRLEHDAYYTDPKLAAFLVNLLRRDGFFPPGAVCMEPSVGRGAFAREIAKTADFTYLVDVQDQSEHLKDIPNSEFHHCRFEDLECLRGGEHTDLVSGNPPYTEAEPHVRLSFSHAKRNTGVVAFLLRLGLLESKARIPFWKTYPATKVYVLSERPSFTGGGTDNSAYGFFVWERKNLNRRIKTELEIVSWGGPDKRKAEK